MSAASPLVADPIAAEDVEHFVHLHGVTWADYQRLLEIRGEKATPRLTYLEGVIEIMSPPRKHESLKSIIGCLVETHCQVRGIDFDVFGSWTLENKAAERGAEPDECYVFSGATDPERPDLVIEVVWTSGRLDKLEVYRKLGVREVWYWRRGVLKAHVLRGDAYEEISASEVLPGIDLAQLASFVEGRTASQAIRAYRDALK